MRWTLASSPTAWSTVSYITISGYLYLLFSRVSENMNGSTQVISLFCCLLLCVHLQRKALCSMPLCVAHKAATSSPSPVRTRPRTTAAWPLLRTRPWPSFAMMLQPGLRPALSSSAKASMSRGTCGIASSRIKAHLLQAQLHHTTPKHDCPLSSVPH